jgi:hypothetical protein
VLPLFTPAVSATTTDVVSTCCSTATNTSSSFPHRPADLAPSATFYILNPTSIAKANMKDNAFQLLTADVNAYNPDVVIITESWLKKSKHPVSN